MPLIEIQLLMPREGLDAWSDALLAAGALSVAIEDEDSATDQELARFGEPGAPAEDPGWRNNRVTVLIDESDDVQALLREASLSIGAGAPTIVRRARLDDRDWVRQSQSQFAPIRIGQIWIVPSWHTPPEPSACVVRIDPGVAFGTGSHPTTQLCLAWLDQHRPLRARVLDYGCGSGILSICAALLGAAEVVGVDIDAQALRTAQDNAQRNGVHAQYTSVECLAADASRRFDLVLANILANPLVLLAPTLVRHLAPGGAIVLSGILERQIEAVTDAYRQADPRLRLGVFGIEQGWAAIVGRRGSD